MFIFLPPSEGKTVPTDARPMAIGSLVLSGVAPTRRSLAGALARLSAGPQDAALAALGLPQGRRADLAFNQTLPGGPASQAADLYSGVLYDALDLPGLRALDPAAYRRAADSVLVFSGLWGVLRPQDRVPRYRCAAGVKLPGVGSVTAVWRAALGAALPDLLGGELVVDLRSTAYAQMWRPRGGAGGGRVVTVRVVHERLVDGVLSRSVVSHFNKATKGRIVRGLLLSGAQPKTPDDFGAALRGLGYPVERAGPGAFDVVVREL